MLFFCFQMRFDLWIKEELVWNSYRRTLRLFEGENRQITNPFYSGKARLETFTFTLLLIGKFKETAKLNELQRLLKFKVEISTRNCLIDKIEQLMVIRRTVIWVVRDGLKQILRQFNVEGANWKVPTLFSWRLCTHLINFTYQAQQIPKSVGNLEVTLQISVDFFSCFFFFVFLIFFTFHLPYSYFWSFNRQLSFSTVFSGRFTTVERQQLHLPTDSYCVVSLPPSWLCKVLLQLLRNCGMDIPFGLFACDPTVFKSRLACQSMFNVYTH